MGDEKKRGNRFEATREALASWRRSYGGRGRPIPVALWSDAADVARVDGVAETARALRLDAKRLAKLVENGTASAPVEPKGFVELVGLGLGGRHEARRVAVFELVGREGDRVRVEVVGDGDAGVVVDLVALARAFWGRTV